VNGGQAAGLDRLVNQLSRQGKAEIKAPIEGVEPE
jgi:hypothetical protein